MDSKKFNIAYFGGSITVGEGASEERYCWRSLVNKWISEKYPDCKVNGINAAIGGTGSQVGVFRADHDLLIYKPDMVFIEFAVNDKSYDDDMILQCMEGIVRKLKKQNKDVKIFFIYTLTGEMCEIDYDMGKLPRTVVLHEKIAQHYKIRSCNVGEALWKKMRRENAEYETYLTDTVHPNDAGYAFYAEEIQRFLSDEFSNKKSHEFDLPDPLNVNPRETAAMLDSFMIDEKEWKKEEISVCGKYPRYISSNVVGSVFELDFFGDCFGVFWMIARDSGIIEWSVDNSEWKKRSSWDEWALTSERAGGCLLEDDLDNGHHIIRIRVSHDKDEKSLGNFIRIGAFLVSTAETGGPK